MKATWDAEAEEGVLGIDFNQFDELMTWGLLMGVNDGCQDIEGGATN